MSREKQVAKRGMFAMALMLCLSALLLFLFACTARTTGRIVRPVYPIQDAPAEAVMAIQGQPAMHPSMLK